MNQTVDASSGEKSILVDSKTETKRLRTNEKVVFGIGDFGANYSWTFIASFIIIYMTDVVGVAGSVIGTIILICRFADGASDLFMGSVIDNTNTKMGKAKPWVFWTAPILGVLTFLLFNIPDFVGYSGKIVYIFIIYFLISVVFYTANNVAYSSLISFMSKDEKDRVSLGSIRFIFSNISVLCITTFTTYLVTLFGENQQGWTYTALVYAFLCAVPLMITGYFVKERILQQSSIRQKVKQNAYLLHLYSNHYLLKNILLSPLRSIYYGIYAKLIIV